METMELQDKPSQTAPSPERLLQMGTGFWVSKIIFAAVKLDLFSLLGRDRLSAEQIRRSLGLHPRGTRDFLDALVSLEILARHGDVYANSQESAFFLDRKSPAYLGDMFVMSNDRLWEFWGRLEEALHTGLPQNETRHKQSWVLDVLYADPVKRDIFLKAMIGLSSGSSMALAQSFDFSGVKRLCDIGGGPGTLCAAVARAHPHVECVNMDLPPVEPVFKEYMSHQGLAHRARFQAGDCFKDPLPAADVYVMGHLLHGWGGGPEKHELLSKAYDALPPEGTLLVIESLIDDERRHNAFGLLMSLDMLIETEHGRNFTAREISDWMAEAGFRQVRVSPLAGPHSVAIGRK